MLPLFRYGDDARQLLYDHFEPVVPQPDDTFVVRSSVFLGGLLPRLLYASMLESLMADCFASACPERMNRESLITAAGLGHFHDVSVHVGSSWVPLRPWQLAHLVPGLLISFVPERRLFRPGVSLQLMLLRRDGWTADPLIPGNIFERIFYVLTDACPVSFHADGCNRDTFRAELAAELRTTVDRLSVQPSLPNLADLELQGRICHRVLVATENIVRIPVPPGRLRRSQHPCLLDLRPVFGGLKWVLVEQGQLSVLQVLRSFVPVPPRRMRANFLGVAMTHRADGSWIQVWPGQVLTVHFLRDDTDSEDVVSDDSWPSEGDGPPAYWWSS